MNTFRNGDPEWFLKLSENPDSTKWAEMVSGAADLLVAGRQVLEAEEGCSSAEWAAVMTWGVLELTHARGPVSSEPNCVGVQTLTAGPGLTVVLVGHNMGPEAPQTMEEARAVIGALRRLMPKENQ